MTNFDDHYQSMGIQPIDVMQEQLTHEEFIGFLKGQIIKYKLRAGHKEGESYSKDKAKERRYMHWLAIAKTGLKVDPRL